MSWLIGREPVSAWTHGAWMLISLPASYVLWRLSRGDGLKRVGMAIFGLGLVACFGGSWLYHSAPLPERDLDWFARFDYIGIYLLIASSATPIGLTILCGRWRLGLLTTLWTLALTGIVLQLTGVELPAAAGTCLYLAMGWVGCVTYFELARCLSHRALCPLWIGGLFYSIGALAYLFQWPTLAPGAFGNHELFHVLVMLGSLAHYYFMLVTVLPYVRPRPALAVVAQPAESSYLTHPLQNSASGVAQAPRMLARGLRKRPEEECQGLGDW
jgi:hemolysin III